MAAEVVEAADPKPGVFAIRRAVHSIAIRRAAWTAGEFSVMALVNHPDGTVWLTHVFRLP
jgi:hypothetical protein